MCDLVLRDYVENLGVYFFTPCSQHLPSKLQGQVFTWSLKAWVFTCTPTHLSSSPPSLHCFLRPSSPFRDSLVSSLCALFILPTFQPAFPDPSHSRSLCRWGEPGLSPFFGPEGERAFRSYIFLRILCLQLRFPSHCPYLAYTAMSVTLGEEAISSGRNCWSGLRKQDWADYHWGQRSNGSC